LFQYYHKRSIYIHPSRRLLTLFFFSFFFVPISWYLCLCVCVSIDCIPRFLIPCSDSFTLFISTMKSLYTSTFVFYTDVSLLAYFLVYSTKPTYNQKENTSYLDVNTSFNTSTTRFTSTPSSSPGRPTTETPIWPTLK